MTKEQMEQIVLANMQKIYLYCVSTGQERLNHITTLLFVTVFTEGL